MIAIISFRFVFTPQVFDAQMNYTDTDTSLVRTCAVYVQPSHFTIVKTRGAFKKVLLVPFSI